jgi:hypothetical protein
VEVLLDQLDEAVSENRRPADEEQPFHNQLFAHQYIHLKSLRRALLSVGVRNSRTKTT